MKTTIIFLFFSIILGLNSFSNPNQKKLIRQNITVEPFVRNYSKLNSLRELDSAYNIYNNELHSQRSKTVNELAYIKSILELSFNQKAFKMLVSVKVRIDKKDNYLNGIYYLVYARLMHLSNNTNLAYTNNEKSIYYLKKSNQLDELKNAYVNQGFYANFIEPEKALFYYNLALELEKRGVMAYYLSLRTNLAFSSLTLNNDPEKALYYCNQALQFMKSHKEYNYLDEYKTVIILASIHEVKGNFELENYYLSKSKDIAVKHGMNLILRNIANAESYNLSASGKYREAVNCLRDMDSLNSLLELDKISEAMAVFEIDTKLKYEKKQKQRLTQILKLKRKQQLILMVSLTLISLALFGILILLFNIRRKNKVLVSQNIELASNTQARLKVDTESKDVNMQLIIELEKLIFDKKMYQNSTITLEKIAKKLNSNRTYLSEAINIYYKENYSNWINKIRINQARKLLASPEFDFYSIEGISKMVGYTSISTFNTSFKKITGLSPSHFKNIRDKV
jgi:AraC-like DNA-binding protein